MPRKLTLPIPSRAVSSHEPGFLCGISICSNPGLHKAEIAELRHVLFSLANDDDGTFAKQGWSFIT
jgi:hypothetical protein